MLIKMVISHVIIVIIIFNINGSSVNFGIKGASSRRMGKEVRVDLKRLIREQTIMTQSR